ncbi:hypothetical protein GCM10027612_27760 [Microbispora bryophytorum subsp. camponoti]
MLDTMNELNDMNGKAALVTGGGRGIGAAVVLKLAERGADVALTYERDDDSAAAVAEKVKAMGGGRWSSGPTTATPRRSPPPWTRPPRSSAGSTSS